jgi:hypothetical protein
MALEFEESSIPFSRGPDLYVRRLKAGEKMTFVILSDAFWGLRVHWDSRGRRTQPHYRNKGSCPGCKLGWPQKWKGYLHVLNGAGEEILEVTPVMHDAILDQIGPGVSLRGHRFLGSRGQGDKARVTFTAQAHWSLLKASRELPEAKDPKPILLELWGLGDVRLGDDSQDAIPFPEAI